MKYLLASLMAVVIGEFACAESPAIQSVGGSTGMGTTGIAPCDGMVGATEVVPCTPRFWGGGEYLLWWIKDGPVAGPLVTTGNPADPVPGALGQAGTQVLTGASAFHYQALSGGRATFGGWIDEHSVIGIEVSGLLLERAATGFTAFSDSAGNPPVYVAVLNQTPTSSNFGNEGSVGIADVPNAGLIGGVSLSTTSRLWGAEANAVANLYRSGGLTVNGVVGFRHLNLDEGLTLTGISTDITGVGINQDFVDQFSTSNHFYGGQLGAIVNYQVGGLLLGLVGKVGLGTTHQTVNVQGRSNWSGPGFPFPPGAYPGGILTEPSNIGQQTSDRFTVVPEIGVKVGWEVTNWARLTVGYDFLYWSNVVRPGNQIDRNVNFTQIPGAQPFFGPPSAPFVPAPRFDNSDFYAHGLSFGLSLSY